MKRAFACSGQADRAKGEIMGIWTDIKSSHAPALSFMAMGMAWAAFAAQVPVLKAQIGASDAGFGLSFLVSSIGALTAMWLASRVDRRFGARSVQMAAAAVALVFVLPSLTTGLVTFTIAMTVVAMSSGVSDILMNARVSEIEAARKRPLMNLNHALFSFAYAGTALATGVAREAGFGPFVVFSVVGLITLIMCRYMHSPHTGSVGEPANAPTRVNNALVWMIGFVVLAAFFAEQAVEGWSALHLERSLGGDAVQGALGPAILGLTMGFGRLFGQVVAAHVRDTVMIGIACFIAAIGLGLTSLAPTLLMAYLGFGLAGLGISVVVPLAMGLAGRVVPQSERVAAIGQVTVIGYGAFLLGPGVMGLTSDAFGLPVAFMLVAIVLVLVAILLAPVIARRVLMSDAQYPTE
ncbi:MAG: MFS family permease [Paracoccaceae bacterium]